MKIRCPDCQQQITLPQNVVVGDIIECENCGTELEVVRLNPPEVRIVEEEK
ncbi:lysine biosynthesis protein LysW [bacterium]|nr:lysine biosynthesis protein LysW [bacterium]